ncbi:glyoxalase family protein [Penicillium freii]|nr:glyoxalase family protein [Penicillium freii]
MSQEPAPGLVLLTELATIIRAIAANLRENRLDRKSFQGLLYEYASRAGSDGQLICASRQNPRSINPGLFLAYTHVELVSWLVKNNYTMNSTSVKWYSWKKIFSKYRLPLFSISSQTAELHENLQNIEKKAGMTSSAGAPIFKNN